MTVSGAEKFEHIYARAATRKGSVDNLEKLLSRPLSKAEIEKVPNDRFLSAFTKKIFQSGFVWRVVEQKWPHFEREFFQFNIEKLLLMSDELLEKKATNPDIIRNLTKVRTIRENALMISEFSEQYGSFGRFVSQHSSEDMVGLWATLKAEGARLGGNIGPYGLRAIGVDTFLITRDIESYFVAHKLISGSPRSKRSLAVFQTQFNQWQVQSHRSYQEISQIVSLSVGDNYRQA